MEYQEFKIMIQERMQEMMGETIEVRIEKYFKNNHTEVEVLTFKDKNPLTSTVISPAVHLKDLYALYQQDGDMAECLSSVKKLYEEYEPKSIGDISGDWAEIKGQFSMSLMHKAWNEKWLKEDGVPFKEYLDFAIILRRTLKVTKHGTGSIVVNKEMMSLMKVTEDEVWEGAWENLYQEEFSIQDINEVIRLESEGKEDGIKPSDFEEMPPMYVLSNKSRDWGARAILRTDLLQKFAEEMDCNLYILPSSVHEVILIPDSGKIETDKLRKDVKEINAACVAEQERLSDEVYYYRRETNAIELAK